LHGSFIRWSDDTMKNAIWVYVFLAGLSILFVFVSLLIVLFGARPSLVKRKLRLGGLIIAFNTMLSGCYSNSGETGKISCYGVGNDEKNRVGSDRDTDTTLDTDTLRTTDTATGEDIMCYEVELTDSDSIDAVDSETGAVFSNDDLACYDTEEEIPTPIDTDIECYDIAEYSTDTETQETAPQNADAGDSDTTDTAYTETDIACYAAPEDSDATRDPVEEDAGGPSNAVDLFNSKKENTEE
jgi:hypothetical protein